MLDSDLNLGRMFEQSFLDAHDGYPEGEILPFRSPETGYFHDRITTLEITVVLWSSLLMCAFIWIRTFKCKLSRAVAHLRNVIDIVIEHVRPQRRSSSEGRATAHAALPHHA